jgi:hypothetical protein
MPTPAPRPFRALTRFDQGTGDLLALRRLMTYSRRFARNIRVRQLPSRLDPQVFFDAMVK